MASLSPKTGLLGIRLASHLLRRTTFNITKKRINDFAKLTAAEAVNELLKVPALQMPKGPIIWTNGKLLVNPGAPNDESIRNYQKYSTVRAWFLYETVLDTSIKHKLVWFLHTCFVAEAKYYEDTYYYLKLLQEFALGNLRILTEKVTLDNLMLKYLDNTANTKFQPNENYARELLELFTILKGPQIGPGNYTNYTEEDIVEAAKVLTGFTVGENYDPKTNIKGGRAKPNDHSTEDKTFSEAFQNKVIKGRNTEEGMFEELSEFIQMIFDQEETARAFCRRLYRFFVKDSITQEVEKDIIQPLAKEMKANDYQMRTTIEKLLISQHFYDADDNNANDEIIGGKIKSPLDLMLGVCSFFDLVSLFPDPGNYKNGDAEKFGKAYQGIWDFVVEPAKEGQMNLLEPSSVLGYTPYAQAPRYSKLWFDGATIIERLKFPDYVISGRYKYYKIYEKSNFRLDIVKYVDQNFDNPDNVDALIQQFITYLLPEQPSKERIDYFKDLLLSELPEMDWTLDWNLYKKENDPEYVRSPLENLIRVMLRSPEYQTL